MKSKQKLYLAAVQLFKSKGYENTTIQEIAERAGVTERTFYRQFKDKSDVLFDSENMLGQEIAGYLSENDAFSDNPLELLVKALIQVQVFDKDREQSIARTKIVQSHPDLRERELLKMEDLAIFLTSEMIEKGAQFQNEESVIFDKNHSELAVRVALQFFHLAFSNWLVDGSQMFGAHVEAVYQEFLGLIS